MTEPSNPADPFKETDGTEKEDSQAIDSQSPNTPEAPSEDVPEGVEPWLKAVERVAEIIQPMVNKNHDVEKNENDKAWYHENLKFLVRAVVVIVIVIMSGIMAIHGVIESSGITVIFGGVLGYFISESSANNDSQD